MEINTKMDIDTLDEKAFKSFEGRIVKKKSCKLS